MPPKHDAFACDVDRADLELELTRDPLPMAPMEPLFESQGIWRVHGDATHVLYRFDSPSFSPSTYKAVWIDRAYQRGRLHYFAPASMPVHPLDVPLEQLLLSHRLAHDGAVEVHACGLVVDGHAALICGASGAGKSTTARLWEEHAPDVEILSDDRVIVRGGERPTAAGTPWHGDGLFASASTAPLRAIFLLRHGSENRLTRLSQPALMRELYRLTFPPAWSRIAIDRILATLEEVATRVPGFVFDALPEASAVGCVRDALRSLST